MSPDSYAISRYPDRWWGHIATPRRWSKSFCPGKIWCGDNDIFNGAFDPGVFLNWLYDMRPFREQNVFVVAPDAVGDPIETRRRFDIYAPLIRALGFPVAFAAQDGQEQLPWPDEFEAVFVGGSTEWKLSRAADYCIEWGQVRGKWIHVGRVNSQRRIRHFQLVGVHSVDGTAITFAPDREFKRLHKQLAQPPLFTMGGHR